MMGFFRSGDLGVRSGDGYITLQGRGKELIICGGFNVYPREVEEFLTKLPGVREAAVIGVDDQLKGPGSGSIHRSRGRRRTGCRRPAASLPRGLGIVQSAEAIPAGRVASTQTHWVKCRSTSSPSRGRKEAVSRRSLIHPFVPFIHKLAHNPNERTHYRMDFLTAAAYIAIVVLVVVNTWVVRRMKITVREEDEDQ